MGDSSNACDCLYRSLKLSTDDQVTSQRFNSKLIILGIIYFTVLCDVRFN